MPGSAKPGWSWMPESDLETVGAHVRELALAGIVDELRNSSLDSGLVQWARARELMPPGAAVDVGSAQEPTPALLELREQLFDANSSNCHGTDGSDLLIRMRWKDARPDAPSGPDAAPEALLYADAVALQLSAVSSPPIFGMGQDSAHMYSWHWRANFRPPIEDLLLVLRLFPHRLREWFTEETLDPAVTSIDTRPAQISSLRLVYVNTKVAKLPFDTDGPALASATWSASGSQGATLGTRYKKNHTLILSGLTYQRLYSVPISVADLGGKVSSMRYPGGLRTPGAVNQSAAGCAT